MGVRWEACPPGSGAEASPSLGGPGFIYSVKAWTEDPPAGDSTCNPGTEATPALRPPVPKDRSLMEQLLMGPQSRGAAPREQGTLGPRIRGPGPPPTPELPPGQKMPQHFAFRATSAS